MAVCPRCEWNVNTAHMMQGEMACPHCRTSLRFNRKEYRNAASPGLVLAFAIIFNMLAVQEPVQRGVISGVLLIGWLVFFRGYKRYLRSATLEVKERMDAGQDI
jgi:hypothetical protein